MADLRSARLTGATLDGANFTGARVAGITKTGRPAVEVRADWMDASESGEGKERVPGARAADLLMGDDKPHSAPAEGAGKTNRRYFGKGDVLRGATLEFDDGATVEIESRFEQCTISLGRGTELVIGESGVLAGCHIKGAGNITVHGQFFEREAPGIVGASQLTVTAGGALVGAVEQPEGAFTNFAFEPGCKLRMQIMNSRQMAGRQA